MHHAPATQIKPNESAIRHRLAMMWFADIYPQYVREDATVSSSSSVPPEYLSPYPNPWYWPKNNPQTKQAQKTESRSTALEATRATASVQSKNDPIIYPSWLDFWEGKVPEYPLPEIPNVIVPDIPPSKFMEVFRETQGLRIPYRKAADTEVSTTEKGGVSTVEGLTAIRGADYRLPWEAESESEPKLKEEKYVKDYLKDFKIKYNKDLHKFIDSIGTIGVAGFTGKKDDDPKDDDPKDDDPKDGDPKDDDPKDGDPKDGDPKDDNPKKDGDKKKTGNEIDYKFRWGWDYGPDNWNLGGEDISEQPTKRIDLTWDNENYYEEICCAGLNPDDGFLEAVITIKELEGYSGGLCWPGSFESVGFWLTEPSDTEENVNSWTPGGGAKSIWVGEASIKVHDIPRHKDDDVIVGNQVLGHLNYTLRVQLTEENKKYIRKCYERDATGLSLTRLPALHCVLAWNRKVTEVDFNPVLGWGDVKDFVVQFPILGAWVEVLNQKKYSRNNQGDYYAPITPTHVAALPDGTILIFRYEWLNPFNELDAINENTIHRYMYNGELQPSGFEVFEAALENVKTGKPVKYFDGNRIMDWFSVGRNTCKIYRPYFLDGDWNVGNTNVFEPIEPPLRRDDNIKRSKGHDDGFEIKIGINTQIISNYTTLNAKAFLIVLKEEILKLDITNVYYYLDSPVKNHEHATIKDKIELFKIIAKQFDSEDSKYFPTFCSGHSTLYNGNVFVMGGTLGRIGHAKKGFLQDITHNHHDLGINETVQFDWTSKQWVWGPNMKNGRWYPSSLAMPDKSVIILDGHPQEDYEEYHSNVDIDFFDPFHQSPGDSGARGSIITLPNVGALWSSFKPEVLQREMLSEYSRIFLLPDGSVFSATAVYSFYDPQVRFRDYLQPTLHYDYRNSPGRRLQSEAEPDQSLWGTKIIRIDANTTKEVVQSYSENEQSANRWLTKRWRYNNKKERKIVPVYLPWTMRYVPVYDNNGVPTMNGYWQKVSNTTPGRGGYDESTGALLPLTIKNRWKPTVLMIEHLTAWICSPLEAVLARPNRWDFSPRAWKLLEPQRLEEFRYKSRKNGSMILLADGTALFVGGSSDEVYGQPDGLSGPYIKGSKYYDPNRDDWSSEDVIEEIGINTQNKHPYDFHSLLSAEVYDPFQNIWIKGAAIHEVRGYHSSYILLYDGSVLVGGGEPIRSSLSRRPDLYPDGYPDDAFFHQGFVRNFERYYPEYCSKPRPKIMLDGDDHYYSAEKNNIIKIRFVDDKSNLLTIERVGLVRLSSMTHGFVYDQRYVEVEYEIEPNIGINIKIPKMFDGYNYRNVLPPGSYFIFITFTNGWVSQMEPWKKYVSQGRPFDLSPPGNIDSNTKTLPVFTIFIE